ncbi:CP2D6-like protein [Mya arenaria]|uniref:CP2D6-like protein n=1 Tax=Mya arenaria TaxID=6604 RepID=A0ABY7E4Z5_MYAAR|nr:cytochrome P450 2D6-like [Mya arenaria]XP_052803406.1 cytochrome P450 2D6-like [Mya arenaria]XP_052803407.1 cytochrome P450 2D6-like [Mya arenaria]XP_052803408.1 cytochrome P450 2D6-like [Mya arenaria]WAR04905.1 CP2D6-like protein [Mya arenaria]
MEIVLLCLFVVLSITLATMVLVKSKGARSPPGPRGLPYFGKAFSFPVDSAYLQFSEWARKFGDIFMFSMFGTKVVVLNSPDLIKKAFAGKELALKLSDRPPSFIGHFVGNGYKDILFRRYDELCSKLKSVTLKAMYTARNGNPDFDDMQMAEINDYVRKITNSNGDTNIIAPLQATLCKLIGIMFTGKRLVDDDPVLQAIASFDDVGNELINPAVHLVFKVAPWIRYLPGYYGNLYRKVMASTKTLRNELVYKLKTQPPDDRVSLLSELFKLQTTESWITDDHVLGVIMDLINTSTLTSRGVLSGVLFLLVHHPHMQTKIQQEIDDVIGPKRQPSADDMNKMPYTHACILETLRYQSHLALSATHTNAEEDIEIEGFFIPKGTSVYGNQWHVHHDKRLWTEPWSFRPERFLKEDGSLLPETSDLRHRYFMPFGVGFRSCMGVKTTYSRMFFFVTALLRNNVLLQPTSDSLPSADPMMLTPGTVLQAPEFTCRVVPR